jgi:hypothetical protein
MRKFISALLFTCLAGCHAPREFIPGYIEIRAIDFDQYTQRGFMFTPEPYHGDYEAVGHLVVTVYPSAVMDTVVQKRSYYPDYIIEGGLANLGVDSLYMSAVSLGADAIMNFTTSTVTDHPLSDPDSDREPGNGILAGVRIEGFAIRRKDK